MKGGKHRFPPFAGYERFRPGWARKATEQGPEAYRPLFLPAGLLGSVLCAGSDEVSGEGSGMGVGVGFGVGVAVGSGVGVAVGFGVGVGVAVAAGCGVAVTVGRCVAGFWVGAVGRWVTVGR